MPFGDQFRDEMTEAERYGYGTVNFSPSAVAARHRAQQAAERARAEYEALQGAYEAEIGKQSRIRRAAAEGASSLLEAFGVDRALPYRLAGARANEAAILSGVTRQDAADNPFTVGLGGMGGSTIGTMYLAGRLAKPFMPNVGATVAPTLARQSLATGLGFGEAAGLRTVGGRVSGAVATGQPIDAADIVVDAGKETVIGAVTGAAFPAISRAGRAVGGRAVGIKPGVRPSVAQTVGRRAIEEAAFFGSADFLMTPGDLKQRGIAALQGIILSPATGALDLHHDLTARLGEMTPKENARAAVTLVDEYVKTMPLAEVERYFKSTAGWPGAIRDYALRHIEGNRKQLEAIEWKPETVATLRDVHDDVAAVRGGRGLVGAPSVDAALRGGRVPADFAAFAARRVPGFILPDPTGTVLTPKERAGAPELGALRMDEIRKAGANVIKTSRGTLFFWPDLVEQQLKTPGGTRVLLEQALSEVRGAPQDISKATFTARGLVGSLRMLADRDAIGEVLGYGPGNAVKEGASMLVVGYDDQGYEVRSIATTPERLESTKKALVAAGASPKRIGLYDISAADAIVGRRLKTTWSPEGPKFDGDLPKPQHWNAPKPGQKLLGMEVESIGKPKAEEPESYFATPQGKLIAASRLEELLSMGGAHPLERVRQDMGEFLMREDALERLGREIEHGDAEGLYVAPIKVGKETRWAIVETDAPTAIRPTQDRPIEMPRGPDEPFEGPALRPPTALPPEGMRAETLPAAPPPDFGPQVTPAERAQIEGIERRRRRAGQLPIGPETYERSAELPVGAPKLPVAAPERPPLFQEPAPRAEPEPKRLPKEPAAVVTSRDFEPDEKKRNPLDVGDTEGEPARMQIGSPLTIRTDTNDPVPTHLALIESDDLKASHDEMNRPIEGYPQRFQPRRVAPGSESSETVRKIVEGFETTPNELLGLDQTRASGPPIVWRDTQGEVGVAGKAYLLAGNHRKRSVDELRRRGDSYDVVLREKAPRVGLDVTKFKKPILVRVVDDIPYEKAAALAGPLQEGGRTLTEFERSIGAAQAARLERAADVKVEWAPDGKLEPGDVQTFLAKNPDLAMRLFPRGLERTSPNDAAKKINDVLLGSLPRELLDSVSKAGKSAEDAVYEIAPALHRFRTLAAAGRIKPEWDITPLIGPALKLLPEFSKHVGAGKRGLNEWAQVVATKPLGFAADDDILRVLPESAEQIGVLRDVIGIGTGFAIEDRATGYFARKMRDFTAKAMADLDAGQGRMFDTVVKKPDGKVDVVAELFNKGHAGAVDKLVTAFQKARSLARGQIGETSGRSTEETPRSDAEGGRRSGGGDAGRAVGAEGGARGAGVPVKGAALPRLSVPDKWRSLAALVREHWKATKPGEEMRVPYARETAAEHLVDELRRHGIDARLDKKAEQIVAMREIKPPAERELKSMRDWIDAAREDARIVDDLDRVPLKKLETIADADEAMSMLAEALAKGGDAARTARIEEMLASLVEQRDQMMRDGARPC